MSMEINLADCMCYISGLKIGTSFQLFFFLQVGCGAIGCELLKNFALLGIAGSHNGMVQSLILFLLFHSFHISNI